MILPVLAFSAWPYWDLVQHDIVYYSKMVATKLRISAPKAEGKIRLEVDEAAHAEKHDAEKMPPKEEMAPIQMIPHPPNVLIERESRPASLTRSSSSGSLDSVNSAPEARPAVTPLISDPLAAAGFLPVEKPMPSTVTSSASASLHSQESRDTVASLGQSPLVKAAAAASPRPARTFRRMRSSPAVLDMDEYNDAAETAPVFSSRRLSAKNVMEDGQEERSPALFGPFSPTSFRRVSGQYFDLEKGQDDPASMTTENEAASRRPSLVSPSRFRRMSSLWSVDSTSTLVHDGPERRPSIWSRRKSSARPSFTSRDSAATLVDHPLPSPTYQKHSQSALQQSTFSNLYSQSPSWSLKNPFAAYDASQPTEVQVKTGPVDLEAGPPPSTTDLYNALDVTKTQMRTQPKEGYQPGVGSQGPTVSNEV